MCATGYGTKEPSMNERTRQAALRHSTAVKALLHELARHNKYFSSGSSQQRGILRGVCLKGRKRYGLVLTEARQLLRDEENYQEWRAMNEMFGNAVDLRSAD